MKKIEILFGLATIVMISSLSGCIQDYIRGTGEIQYNDFEGGFYGIVGDDGEKFDPINLPVEFENDGIRIKYVLKILEGQTSIHMWGTVVEIIEIERL